MTDTKRPRTEHLVGLADAFASARARLGLSSRGAAKLAGMSHRHMLLLERTDTNPSVLSFLRACRAYDIDPCDLLEQIVTMMNNPEPSP